MTLHSLMELPILIYRNMKDLRGKLADHWSNKHCTWDMYYRKHYLAPSTATATWARLPAVSSLTSPPLYLAAESLGPAPLSRVRFCAKQSNSPWSTPTPTTAVRFVVKWLWTKCCSCTYITVQLSRLKCLLQYEYIYGLQGKYLSTHSTYTEGK